MQIVIFVFCYSTMWSNKIFLWHLSKWNNSHGSFLPHYGWSWDIFPWQPYNCVSYAMSHEANHIYFSCLVPVRTVFCVATCCCNDRFNETLFVMVFSFLLLTQQTLPSWGWYMWRSCTGSQLQHICDIIKYKMRWDTMPTATWHTPSSFKTGRHSQWWLSTLHLIHSWAQLHRQSLSISTYSCFLQSIQLQWVRSLVCVLTRHNYCGNHSHRNHWVALAFRCIQWHNNVDCCIGCHVGHLLLCDKDDANQQLHKACTGDPLHVLTSAVWGTWHHCCFPSPPRLSFDTGVDCCDDFGHKRGCHLVALWAFKIGGNQCRHDLSLSQWVSLLLAIGSVNNLT